jgi:hypothetical protein
LTALTYGSPEYARQIVQFDLHLEIFGVFKEIKSADCLNSALECVSNIAASSLSFRDACIEIFSPKILIESCNLYSSLIPVVVQLLYSYSSFPLEGDHFSGLTQAVATFLGKINGRELETFLLTLVNLSQSENFDKFIDPPQIVKMIFLNLDHEHTKLTLVLLCSICERNVVANNSFIRRVLFLGLSPGKFMLSALSCELIRIILLKSAEFIELDLRPNVGRVVMSLTRDQPLIVRRFACKAVGAFTHVYPEYIPVMIELGLMECLRDMMGFDETELLVEALLILDCVFGNDMGEKGYLRAFDEMDGFECVMELLQSDVEEIRQTAEVFMLSWSPDIEIDPS